MKKLAVLLLALLALSCTHSTTTNVVDVGKDFDQKTCVAIFPFDNLTDYPNAGRIVADLMGTAFFKSQKFRLMERSEIDRLAILSKVNLPTKIPGRFARSLGEVLEVDAVLVGAVTEYAYLDASTGNPGVSVSASLIDVASGKILWTASHSRTSSDQVQYKKDPVNRVALIAVDEMTQEFFRKIPQRTVNMSAICGNSDAIIPPEAPEPSSEPIFSQGTLAGRTIGKSGASVGSVVLEFPTRDLARILTDPETGSFKIDNLLPGEIRIIANKSGYLTQTFDTEVQAGKMTVLDLEMDLSVDEKKKQFGTVLGKVLDTKGKALAATVFVKSPDKSIDMKASTDNGGKFTIKVPPGTYQVRIFSQGFITQNKKVAVDDQSKTIINVNMHSGRASP